MKMQRITTARTEEMPVDILAQWRLIKDIPLTDWSMVAYSWVDSEAELTERSASSAMTAGLAAGPRDERPVTDGGIPYFSTC